MPSIPQFLTRLWAGVKAFREAYLTSGPVDLDDWTDQDARMLRYDVLWAQYEQTSYRDVHTWATAMRKEYGLYKYVRPIYNPAYRLGEFYKMHLWGGDLDVKAGEEGAIPIETERENLRPAIAELWKWSRWRVKKDILTVRGTILGDAAIQIVDDVQRGRVYLDLLHPGLLEYVIKDPFGNVKGYGIRENRPDPRPGASSSNSVTYTERVSRSGEFVVYETFLNGEPFPWPENVDRTGTPVSAWREPYGFVPLVMIQHNDVGLDWGWSELHPIRGKTFEADDLASMISDQVRKQIEPVWLMKGIKRPSSGSIALTGANAATASGGASDTDRPFPGREELQALWNVDPQGAAEAMVADMQLEEVLMHLQGVLQEIERDVPELKMDIETASGDASGRALRVARQPTVSKVVQRRANYDSALVAAQQMAIAIGGERGYNGYQGFNLSSYEAGALDHSIAERPVFEEDPLDQIEIDSAFWVAAQQAIRAGVSLESYLREAGWTDERIAELDIMQQQETDGQETQGA